MHPTLILQGSRDVAVPPSFARRAAALIPNSRLQVLESGHFIPLNNPRGAASAIRSFLSAD